LLRPTLLYLIFFFLARSAFLFDSPLVLVIVSMHNPYLSHTDH
jgi:hypothetical protein